MSLDSRTETEDLAKGSREPRLGIIAPLLRRLLAGIRSGRLTIVTPSGARLEHRTAVQGPEAVIAFHDWRALLRIISGGDVGFAEAYIAGEWSTPDLAALMTMIAQHGDYLERALLGRVPLRILGRLRHLRNRNSKAGSRRNIAFHYDLGNDFYRLWLDQSMTYSSALYDDPRLALEDAQRAKQAQVIDHLALNGGERVLEIGCGWGSLAMLLGRGGAEVVALSLSERQLDHARELVRAEGVADRVEFRLEDYRDTGGCFDRIVSIEMLEAVGEEYWPVYFAKLRQLLKAGGRAVLQVITIGEDRFDNYRKGADFIQRYIFPGGMLPTKAIVAERLRCAGLTPISVTSFGDSYALTLAEWRRRFLQAWPKIEQLGFGVPFRRMWEYYLAYCEAGFRTGYLDVNLYAIAG